MKESRILSIIESILFASDKPVPLRDIEALFETSPVTRNELKGALKKLEVTYQLEERGIFLREVAGAYQIGTKKENAHFIQSYLKAPTFRLSPAALEVLAMVAYKQPVVKSQLDEIRGVDSSHLLRTLMKKDLLRFAGKSELPGRPMQYAVTKKFLEVFSLSSLKDLPSSSEVESLLPEEFKTPSLQEKRTELITSSLSLSPKRNSSQEKDEALLQDLSEKVNAISTKLHLPQEQELQESQEQNIQEKGAQNQEGSQEKEKYQEQGPQDHGPQEQDS